MLDHDSDVTWFHEHCEVYQKNEDLMAFLRDCAVVVLITGCFQIPKDVQSIHDCYKNTENTFGDSGIVVLYHSIVKP